MTLPWMLLITVAVTSPAVAATDPCAVLTQDEASEALGAPLKAGYAAGPQDSACQWDGNAGNIYLQVQIVDDVRYWEPHRRAPSYKEVTGIGKASYTEAVLGGFVAGANTGRKVILVSESGGNASAENALALLRKIVARTVEQFPMRSERLIGCPTPSKTADK